MHKEVKFWFEIRQQFLNEHHEAYRGFTRLLITLSVAFIVLLAAAMDNLTTSSALLIKLSVSFQLGSLLFGLAVQHQIMMNPLRHLERAQRQMETTQENGDESPIEIRREPSMKERVFYNIQLYSFACSFVLIAIYLVFEAGNA